MLTSNKNRPIQRRHLVAAVCAIAVMFAALVVLTGWIFDVVYLKSVLPGFPQMKPNTAVLFAAAALGLFCLSESGTRGWRRRSIYSCSSFVFLLGIVTLAEYTVGTSIGSDRLFFPDSGSVAGEPFSGYMSPHTAFNFTVLALSLALLNARWFLKKVSEFLAMLIMMTSFASILAYIYDAEHMFGASKGNGMAVNTIVLFTLCSISLLASNKRSRIVDVLTSDNLGGTIARRLLPAVIIIPTFVGWLKLVGQRQGIFDSGFGTSISIFACVVLMFGIVLYFSRTVHRSDRSRRRIESDLIEREQRYRELFDYSQGMICIHDLEGILSTVNPATLSALGYTREEMVGRNIIGFLPEEQRDASAAFFREITNEGLAKGIMPVVSKSGKLLTWSYHSILVTETDKEPYVIGHAQDVTALVEAQRQLKNLTLTDDLTGLYNRRGFLTMAEQQIKLERHDRTARGLTLMFADMDGLKQINDRYGHEAGSDAIVQLSGILASAVRNADLVARWGGDEFVMLTIGSHNEDANTIQTRIADKIKEYNDSGDKPYELACSIGVAPLPLDEETSFESIIAEADEAMYAEKRRRKDLVENSLPPDLDSSFVPPNRGHSEPPGVNSRV